MKPAVAVLLGLALAACAGDATSPDESQLASLNPLGGSVGVSVSSQITITFTHAMAMGMEQYVALHKGSLSGPLVSGTWSWSGDRKTLSFTPAQPLESKTQYAIHVGGNMRDNQNHMVGLERNGMSMGGQWASVTMMGSNTGMMGPGWQHANGAYGMIFTFTTS
jgi:hypothetical protein